MSEKNADPTRNEENVKKENGRRRTKKHFIRKHITFRTTIIMTQMPENTRWDRRTLCYILAVPSVLSQILSIFSFSVVPFFNFLSLFHCFVRYVCLLLCSPFVRHPSCYTVIIVSFYFKFIFHFLHFIHFSRPPFHSS